MRTAGVSDPACSWGWGAGRGEEAWGGGLNPSPALLSTPERAGCTLKSLLRRELRRKEGGKRRHLFNQGSELQQGQSTQSLESWTHTHCLVASGPLASGAWMIVNQPIIMPCGQREPPNQLLSATAWLHSVPDTSSSAVHYRYLQNTAARSSAVNAEEDPLVTGIKSTPSSCVTPQFSLFPHLLGASEPSKWQHLG